MHHSPFSSGQERSRRVLRLFRARSLLSLLAILLAGCLVRVPSRIHNKNVK